MAIAARGRWPRVAAMRGAKMKEFTVSGRRKDGKMDFGWIRAVDAETARRYAEEFAGWTEVVVLEG